MRGCAPAAHLEHVEELQQQQRECDELGADDRSAGLSERVVRHEEDEEEEYDGRVERPVHPAHELHVAQVCDRARLLQVPPYDLQRDKEAGAEQKHAVEVQPVLRRRPVEVHHRDDADHGGEAGHEGFIGVAVRTRPVRCLADELFEHACSRLLHVCMPNVLVCVFAVEARGGLQVVQRHEEHPVELQLDDERYDDHQQVRENKRVRVLLALPHPLADKVKLERVQAQQHREQARDQTHVQEDESRDRGVASGHARAICVVYIICGDVVHASYKRHGWP